jgi:predicted dehydrogenase
MNRAQISHRALVVGAGSIGQRHLKNLRALGVQELLACDPDRQRLEALKELQVAGFTDFAESLAVGKPEIVLICTPPVFHVTQSIDALKIGAHVFIEKPLSNSLENVDRLVDEARERGRVVQVGYNLRFNPGIGKLKQLIDDSVIGRVLWARLEVGQYLPDWRPSQDYRTSYSAMRELGGGIVLDASHEIDYAIWLLGKPMEVACMAGKVSQLEVDVEDCATLLLRFESGAQADIHLDFVQRSYTRCCKIVGELGTIEWDYSNGEIKIFDAGTARWETQSYDFDVNDAYVAELRHFLDCIENRQEPIVDLKQGKLVLEVALAAKSAAETGSTKL